MNLCFYPIIDAQFARGEKAISLAKAIIRGGAKVIQYRNKMDNDEVFEEEARRIMEKIPNHKFQIPNPPSFFKLRRTGKFQNSKFKIQKKLNVCRGGSVRPSKLGMIFIINDRIEIAKKIGADGVHLGGEDIGEIIKSKIQIPNKIQNPNFKYQTKPNARRGGFLRPPEPGVIDLIRHYLGGEDKIVGVTARNLEEAIWAEKAGADYIGLSAVFATATKTDAPAMGLEGLKKIVKAVKIPTVAIGGINEKNIEEVLETGVTGAAMVSAVCLAENPEEAVRRLMFKAGANGGLPVQRSF